jgi:hypothetical protein
LLTSASDTVPDAVAVDPTDHSVLMAARETALHRIRRYRIGASGPAPVVMDFTSTPYFTAGPDGSLFVTLEDRHFSVLRFAETGSPVETVTASATHFGPATALDDGRTLMSSRVTDQTHLFVVAPGKEPLRLAQTDEPTFAPATSIAGGRAALLVGRDAAGDRHHLGLDRRPAAPHSGATGHHDTRRLAGRQDVVFRGRRACFGCRHRRGRRLVSSTRGRTR